MAHLPQSDLAERGVLGSVLLDNSLLQGALSALCTEDFVSSANREIYGVMLKFSEKGLPFDPVIIAQTLEDRGRLEQAGGYEGISSLVDGAVADSTLVKQHAQTILKYSKLRRLRSLGEFLEKAIEAGDAPQAIEALLMKRLQFLGAGLDLEGKVLPDSRIRARTLTAVSAEDLLALEIKPREMLLDPILPEQGLAMLYGYRGTGKTYLTLGIAVAVARGSGFLRWHAPRPRTVLYVDGELPAKTMQERVRTIVGQAPSPQGLRIVTPDLQDWPMPDLASEIGQQRLEPLLEGTDLVILDNLSALCKSGNENEGQDWQPIQEWMLRLRKRGISVLFVHHSGKNRSQRGTSKREDLLDTVIALKHPSDFDPSRGLRCEVHFEKTRGLFGEAATSFEVAMLSDLPTGASWDILSLDDTNSLRAAELFEAGLSVREVAEELVISKSRAGRLRQKWQSGSRLGASPCPTV